MPSSRACWFAGAQFNHPTLTLKFVTTTEFAVRQSMKVGFSVLALAGINGMYLSQVRKSGLLGLVGYLIFAAGFLTMLIIEVVGLVIMPALASSAPRYVSDALAVATGGTAAGDIGLMNTLSLLWRWVPGRRPGDVREQPAGRAGCRTMTTNTTARRASARWVPFALMALSLVPVTSGSLRLGWFLAGPHLMPADARIDAAPLPVILHVGRVIPYSLLGAFQFSLRLRQRRPAWHRAS